MSEQTGVVQDLLEALKALLHAMEMQEGREDGSLLIPQNVAWHIWSEAKDKATAAIARAEGKAEYGAAQQNAGHVDQTQPASQKGDFR